MYGTFFCRCLGYCNGQVFSKLMKCSREICLPSVLVLSNWLTPSHIRGKCFSSVSSGQPWRLEHVQYSTAPKAISHAITTEDTPVRELIEDLLLTKSNKLSVTNSHSPMTSSQQELLLYIVKSDQKTARDTDTLREFILSRIKALNIKFLPVLLSTLLKNNCLSRPILEESAERICELLKDDLEKHRDVNFGKLLWVLGKYAYYDEQLCNLLPKFLQRGKAVLNPWLASNIAWYCARVRYYNPSLLDNIVGYSLANSHRCTLHDLSNVVYSLGYLNHPHPSLMDAVGERLEREDCTEGSKQVYWMYVWSSLVMDTLRPSLLERVLSDEFVQASLKSPDYQLCLLQLSIALNFEHPELNMTGEDLQSRQSKWGACFPSVKGLDGDYMRQSTVSRLQRYRHSASANTFGENVKRALKQVLGKTLFYNSEALSLSGYSLDFELLLDSKNRLIPIPRRWKMKSKEDVLYSINVLKSNKRRSSSTSNLIDSLAKAENSVEKSLNELSVPSNFEYRVQINLASDWGSKFECLPSHSIKRKVAIEADGLPHFACNCDHVLGPTVLKHRQLRALGWDVVQIPYKEWEGLQNGDEHVRYLAEKIFNRTEQ